MAEFVEVMRIKHRICNTANGCENCILSTEECMCVMLDSDNYEGMEKNPRMGGRASRAGEKDAGGGVSRKIPAREARR